MLDLCVPGSLEMDFMTTAKLIVNLLNVVFSIDAIILVVHLESFHCFLSESKACILLYVSLSWNQVQSKENGKIPNASSV